MNEEERILREVLEEFPPGSLERYILLQEIEFIKERNAWVPSNRNITVGSRIQFSAIPGCVLDITIDEIEERPDRDDVLIKKATVHSITMTSPLEKFKLPDGWITPE